MKLCPSCGNKKGPKHLVCSDCYQIYSDEAAKSIARGKVVDLLSWAKQRAEKRLPEIKAELKEKKDKYDLLQQEVGSSAFQKVKETLNGKMVPNDVFKKACSEARKKTWKEKGGNTLHYEIKILEQQVEDIENFLAQKEN